jgi:hypothetical protein
MRGGGWEVDDSELRTLQIDLSEAPGRMQRGGHKTLGRAGDLVNRGMKRDARGHRQLPRLPKSVTNEFIDYWTQEIGLSPIPETQGRLAHIIVYGSINNEPVYDHTAALRRETPTILEMFAGEAEEDVLGSSAGQVARGRQL